MIVAKWTFIEIYRGCQDGTMPSQASWIYWAVHPPKGKRLDIGGLLIVPLVDSLIKVYHVVMMLYGTPYVQMVLYFYIVGWLSIHYISIIWVGIHDMDWESLYIHRMVINLSIAIHYNVGVHSPILRIPTMGRTMTLAAEEGAGRWHLVELQLNPLKSFAA